MSPLADRTHPSKNRAGRCADHLPATGPRHKQQDPQLSVNGKQRASELARILSNAGVTHLFSSQFRRSKSTLQPLAEKTGGEIVIIRAQQSADQVEALRDLPPGSVAVVAGHSNTIPALVCALAGAAPDLDCSDSSPTLDKEEYDRLYVVILPPAGTGESVAATTLSLRY